MSFITQIIPYRLRFKNPATTSRGTYHDRPVWYVVIYSPNHPERLGIGECAPLPDLSDDYVPDYLTHLQQACQVLQQTGYINYSDYLRFPSILFGLETALAQFNKANSPLWHSPFTTGKRTIPINGLIWMGQYDHMLTQIEQKLAQGFSCIKLKIGAINFTDELALLKSIRQHFSAKEIAIRLDANGAFHVNDVQQKLQQLADWDIHSIEQPIAAGQSHKMAYLVNHSPIPIALDEELIGHYSTEEKIALLSAISPQFIIIKPSLHGGIVGSQEWIKLAEAKQIGWWFTSALESNIGLNAIAQLASMYQNPLPQGLGTGLLYHNNLPLPLSIRQGNLCYDPVSKIDWLSLVKQLNTF